MRNHLIPLAFAIAAALAQGLRTADIKSEGTRVVTTAEMGDAIVGEMKKL